MLPLRKIICPTDFSDFARGAMDKSGELAAHFGAELCLLHVTQPVPPLPGLAPYPGGTAFDATAYGKAVQGSAEQELRHLIERRPRDNVKVRPLLRRGQAADEIVSVATQEDAGLIVIATHGASAWRTVVSGTAAERILFGSVTTNVMRLSPCPILTVRMPTTA